MPTATKIKRRPGNFLRELNFAACIFFIAATTFAYSGDERCIGTSFPRVFLLANFGLPVVVFAFKGVVEYKAEKNYYLMKDLTIICHTLRSLC
jgi:hypothetical protein